MNRKGEMIVRILLVVGVLLLLAFFLSPRKHASPAPVGVYVAYRHSQSRLLVNTSNGKLCWPANQAKEGQIPEINFPACGSE